MSQEKKAEHENGLTRIRNLVCFYYNHLRNEPAHLARTCDRCGSTTYVELKEDDGSLVCCRLKESEAKEDNEDGRCIKPLIKSPIHTFFYVGSPSCDRGL